MLFTLSIRVFSILIRIILNYWPDNSNIPATSGSDTCSVFSLCLFIFCNVLKFLFPDSQDDAGDIGTAVNNALLMWWQGVGEGSHSKIRSQSE